MDWYWVIIQIVVNVLMWKAGALRAHANDARDRLIGFYLFARWVNDPNPPDIGPFLYRSFSVDQSGWRKQFAKDADEYVNRA